MGVKTGRRKEEQSIGSRGQTEVETQTWLQSAADVDYVTD